MNIFISGGAKNGKSYFAQEKARDMALEYKVPLYYLATMIPHDKEDIARIKRHIKEREGWGFDTIEQGTDILTSLQGETASGQRVDPKGVFLLDSVTALLANEMFKSNGQVDFEAGNRLAEELTTFAKSTGNTVFVSDYIYSDATKFDDFTEDYRKALAFIDRKLAEICEQVVEVSFGFKNFWK